MKKSLFLDIICCLLIALFFYAALSKWVNFDTFQGDMGKQPLPSWFTRLLIWLLPPIEIVIAFLLMFDRTKLVALLASLVLMGAFTVYTAAAIFNVFPSRPCGCGGIIRELSWTQHFYFNLFFVAISFIGISLQKQLKKKIELIATYS